MREGVPITALMTENVEQSVMDAIASGHGMVQIRGSGMEAKAGMKRAIDEGTDALSIVLSLKFYQQRRAQTTMRRSGWQEALYRWSLGTRYQYHRTLASE
jgi:hypothetical protein